jgi:hypothetical protein
LHLHANTPRARGGGNRCAAVPAGSAIQKTFRLRKLKDADPTGTGEA